MWFRREKVVSELIISLGKAFQITGVCHQGCSTKRTLGLKKKKKKSNSCGAKGVAAPQQEREAFLEGNHGKVVLWRWIAF